ncbi:DUF4245 domain-containing protein [Specibacter cremeus]|uniref:DUF4245 domain-containing protein n=1 Tax=Specibacter cremeus TaxID=1629051 RepID=UPI0013DDC534|nr:DUF4245 domain-containing protein [Specibacter cremeus]
MSETPEPPPEMPSVKPVISAAAAKRANASVIGMILAMLATVAIVLVVVGLNPQKNATSYIQPVDVAAVAGQAAPVAGFAPAAPHLPAGWRANYARWNGANGPGAVAYWDVGNLTPHDTFIALRQTDRANPTWLAGQTGNAPVTGTRQVAGTTWELRDDGSGSRSLVATINHTTVILTGKADFVDFDALAAATSRMLAGAPTPSTTATPKETN